jgi:hypothetical protein
LTEHRLTDGYYFWLVAVFYGAVLLAFLFLLIAKGDAWMKYDTGRFFDMADTILGGGTPYVDFMDPKPPLIFFTLVPLSFLGIKMAGGYVLVALCNLASALLIFKAGWRLYGRFAGLLAGLLFVVNLPWTEGFFILTEPFCLLFILASAYALLFWDIFPKYLVAGACAGIAIGFKQYALLAIPLSLLLLYMKGELKGLVGFALGAVLVLGVIFGALYIAYGPAACQSALYWSFGVAGEYVAQDSVGGGVSAWKPVGPVDIALNMVYVLVAVLSLLVFAAASFWKGGRREAEVFFFASGLAYAGTLLIRPYFHYLVLALPYAALLCASTFRDKEEFEDEAGEDFDVPEETYASYGPADGTARFK